jgi:hypothetical protein
LAGGTSAKPKSTRAPLIAHGWPAEPYISLERIVPKFPTSEMLFDQVGKNNAKKVSDNDAAFAHGGPGRTRTCNQTVMSRRL